MEEVRLVLERDEDRRDPKTLQEKVSTNQIPQPLSTTL